MTTLRCTSSFQNLQSRFIIQYTIEKKAQQAYHDGLLLDGEKTDELKAAAQAEEVRQAASARDRANTRVRMSAATTSRPPSDEEYNRCVLFVDAGIQLTGELQATLMKHNGNICREPSRCNFFLAVNPWQPVNPLIKWAAALKGAWVLSPDCFLGKAGASIKYKSAIFIKRQVWVSAAFQHERPLHWITLLEILQSHPGLHSWKLIHSPAAWATARARAESVKRPTEVLAIVSSGEAHQETPGTLGLGGATDFFASNVDKARGSVGLLQM